MADGTKPICLKSQANSYKCPSDESAIDPQIINLIKEQATKNLDQLMAQSGNLLPAKLKYDFSRARWGSLYYPEPKPKEASMSLVSLEIPLVSDEGVHSDQNSLTQKIIFKAHIQQDGKVAWAVDSDFIGTGDYTYVEALLDSAAMSVDWNYFQDIIKPSHLDYALLVPVAWGNGNNPSGRVSVGLDLFTHALKQEPKKGDRNQQIELAQIASSLPNIPLEQDSWFPFKKNFWQLYTYGEVICLRQLFDESFDRFGIDRQSPLGKLIQRNINRLNEVREAMEYGDDFDDDGVDPEVHKTALDNAKKFGGPLPPEMRLTLQERINEYIADQAVDIGGRIIEKSIPKIEAAIDRLKPKLEQAIADITVYLKDPRNTEELRQALQDLLTALKPVIEKNADELLKSLTARLKRELPQLIILVDKFSKHFAEDTYPNTLKPVVTDLSNMLRQLTKNIKKNSGGTTPQENPHTQGTEETPAPTEPAASGAPEAIELQTTRTPKSIKLSGSVNIGHKDISTADFRGVILDANNYPMSATYMGVNTLEACKALGQNGDYTIVYQRTGAMWPVDPRQYVIAMNVKSETKDRVEIEWNLVRIPTDNNGNYIGIYSADLNEHKDDAVYTPFNHGSWVYDRKLKKITYTLDSDTGGTLPDWMKTKGAMMAFPTELLKVKWHIEGDLE